MLAHECIVVFPGLHGLFGTMLFVAARQASQYRAGGIDRLEAVIGLPFCELRGGNLGEEFIHVPATERYCKTMGEATFGLGSEFFASSVVVP